MFLNNYLEDGILMFGKHKGMTLTEVLEEYPSYIVWLYEDSDIDIITEDLYLEALDAVEENGY